MKRAMIMTRFIVVVWEVLLSEQAQELTDPQHK